MDDSKIVLITGVSQFWGSEIAKALIARDKFHVIGYDSTKPETEIDGLDFIQADIRNPLIVDLLKSEQVDTVCHVAFEESLRPNEASFDLNVMGTIKLFGACAEAGVRKIVFLSSTMVYGAHPDNPGFLLEDSPLRGDRKYGYNRDLVEIESFCNGFMRQFPQVILTILRFPGIIGPNADTPLTRFLTNPKAPILLGFDPMLQVIHEKDVISAITHVVTEDHPGVYNVAAEGIHPLLRMMRIAGKLPVPVFHLLAYWGINAFSNSIQKHWPIEPDYLRYRWVADVERMRTDLNWLPAYTAEEALREFAGIKKSGGETPTTPDLDYDMDRLRDTIERRQRERDMAAASQAVPAKAARGKKHD
jgi:UDP-glucose 4-epimerase